MKLSINGLIAGLCLITAPASAQIAILTEAVLEHQAVPGEKYTGVITLKNATATPYDARIYQTDYVFQADGNNAFGPPASVPRSNARWVSFTPDYITIPPGQSVTIQYAVAVPKTGPALTGTYWSMLMVETVSPGSPDAPRGAVVEPQLGLRTRMRYGTQIATHLSGTGLMELAFNNIVVTGPSPDREATLSLDVSNPGERGARPKMTLELYDSAGRLAGKFDQQRGLLYPGTSLRQQFQLGALRRGTYKAIVLADAGGDDIFVGQYDVIL